MGKCGASRTEDNGSRGGAEVEVQRLWRTDEAGSRKAAKPLRECTSACGATIGGFFNHGPHGRSAQHGDGAAERSGASPEGMPAAGAPWGSEEHTSRKERDPAPTWRRGRCRRWRVAGVGLPSCPLAPYLGALCVNCIGAVFRHPTVSKPCRREPLRSAAPVGNALGRGYQRFARASHGTNGWRSGVGGIVVQ